MCVKFVHIMRLSCATIVRFLFCYLTLKTEGSIWNLRRLWHKCSHRLVPKIGTQKATWTQVLETCCLSNLQSFSTKISHPVSVIVWLKCVHSPREFYLVLQSIGLKRHVQNVESFPNPNCIKTTIHVIIWHPTSFNHFLEFFPRECFLIKAKLET